MKDKVLCLLDAEWIHFGIVKFFQENYDCDLYSIVDIDNYTKTFFKNQKLINFKTIWFYRDYISLKLHDIDYDFLKKFESKYKISLWSIAYSERFFLNYNKFHKFNHKEILTLLEQESKLFDKILDQVNPDYLIIKLVDSHQSNLLHKMCNNKGIKILMLGPTRFASKWTIYHDYEIIDKSSRNDNVTDKERTNVEIQEYIKNYNALKTMTPLISSSKTPFTRKLCNYIFNLKLLSQNEVQNYYAHYGKSWFKLITQFIFLKKKIRQNFIDKNFTKQIDTKQPFLYFPLHVEPERQLLVVTPFYTNQIELISNIAKSVPIQYKLYVKEHPMMELKAWRETSFYKKILALPNVTLIHPSVKSEELIKNSDAVITVNGTTGVEATLLGKPVIAFADVSYAHLPNVTRVYNIEKLPKIIIESLNKTVDLAQLNKYINFVENHSFDLDLQKLRRDFQSFFTSYNPAQSNVNELDMKRFLEEHKEEFEILTREHIQKINQYKQNEQNTTSLS